MAAIFSWAWLWSPAAITAILCSLAWNDYRNHGLRFGLFSIALSLILSALAWTLGVALK